MTVSTQEAAALSVDEKRALLEELLRKKAGQAKALFPLSHGQEALWFLYNLAPDSAAYNNLFGVRIRSQVDVPALQRAFRQLQQRHPSLRVVFLEQDGKPMQKVQEDAELDFALVDASGWNTAELNRRLHEEAQRPFDLERGPILQVHLFSRAEDDHVLFLRVHHISFDFWSFAVLIDELRALYPAEVNGVTAKLPPPPGHYADFVKWEHDMLAGERGEELWQYWRQQLDGAMTELNLAADRPRPPAQTYEGASLNFKVEKELAERLKAVAQKEGATMFMATLAAFQTLLFRYTAQEDILVGSPTAAGRGRKEFADSVGYFVNPIVFRANMVGNPTFTDFLAQVRQTVLDGLKHQDYPFPLLVEKLNLPRDASRSPLFQVWFALQKLHRMAELSPFVFPMRDVVGEARMDLGGLAAEPYTLPQQEGQFDLMLEMIDIDGALMGVFKYNTDLFDASMIERMAGHFHVLLEGIAEDPHRRLTDLPLLTAAERHQLLVEWNDTDTGSHRPWSKEATLHRAIESQVANAPDSPAVIFEDKQLTYAELNGRANQLAHHLRGLGVGPDALVGILIDRSLEMVVGLLGILKAGGAYVPLDPAYPDDRLSYMVEDAQIGVLLTQTHLADQGWVQATAATTGFQTLCIDSDWPTIAQNSDANPDAEVTGQNLAYVIYTSGSTGRPKGVQIPHHAVINFLNSMRKRPGLAASDILLAVTTLSFDIAGLELYLPLTTGARVVVASREMAADGAQLLQLMDRCGATVMQATPATWRMLLEAGWGRASNEQRAMSNEYSPNGKVTHYSLKILCGGEALPRELANQMLERCGSLWNVYGPTETTIWSAVHKVEKEGPIVLGRPLDNQMLYVLDKELNLVPVGVPGELHIGGDGLARGYRNRPDLTAEKFIPNPFATEGTKGTEGTGGTDESSLSSRSSLDLTRYARIYKTGDLARFRPDGTVEYLGRTDFQVKIRGFRIELGEIESVLETHPQVRQAVVNAVADTPGGSLQRLVAYVIPETPGALTAGDARAFLREKLPDYMVPTAYLFMESFPLTLNGKVNRRALPRPELTDLQLSQRYVAPRDELEMQLVNIWEEVLAIKPIGVQDNFFELGAHSILAVRLFAEIGRVQNRTLPLTLLFQAPTVEQLAELLRHEGWQPSWSSLVPIQPAGSRPPFFCVHGLGGHVLLFRDLAGRLGKDQPFYGLQAQGLNGEAPPHDDVEAMAAYYIKEIRALQPKGPYRLGSLCYGIIGYEMARQLQAQGEEVSLLVMLDAFPPPSFYERPLSQLGRRVLYRLQHAPLTLWPYFKDRIVQRNYRKVRRLVYRLADKPAPKMDLTDAHLDAVHKYEAKQYVGKTVFIWSDEYHYAHIPTYEEKWAELVAGEIHHHYVQGTHQGMMGEPHVAVLTETLRPYLEE